MQATADAAFAVCILCVQFSMHTGKKLIEVRVDAHDRKVVWSPMVGTP